MHMKSIETQVVCSTYTVYRPQVMLEVFSSKSLLSASNLATTLINSAYQINVCICISLSSYTNLALCWRFD